MTQNRGSAPLAPTGKPTVLRLPEELRNAADRYGKRHGLPSRAAVIRLALRRLLTEEAIG